MSQLQNCLEYADTPEFLVSTVDVILELIDLYPSVFTKHFRVCIWNVGKQEYLREARCEFLE